MICKKYLFLSYQNKTLMEAKQVMHRISSSVHFACKNAFFCSKPGLVPNISSIQIQVHVEYVYTGVAISRFT